MVINTVTKSIKIGIQPILTKPQYKICLMHIVVVCWGVRGGPDLYVYDGPNDGGQEGGGGNQEKHQGQTTQHDGGRQQATGG